MQWFFLGDKEFRVFRGVYQPAEDSYLLADSVKTEPHHNAIDIGCGTGIQGLNVLLKGAQKCVFSDVNEIALENARHNVSQLKLEHKTDFLHSNLFKHIDGKYDLIVFNPPYLVSDRIEHADLDAGHNGRRVLDHFLKQFPIHLSENGACYFLQSSLNGMEKTEKLLAEHGMDFSVVARQKLFFEEIMALKATKK